MFGTICIKPNEHTFPTDFGFIAENLLYYKQVILIVGSDTLPILFKNCDIEILYNLLERKVLKILVRENLLGVMSQETETGLMINDVMSVTSDKLNTEQIIYDGLFNSSGRKGYSKRNTQKLLKVVEPFHYDKNICDIVRDDIAVKSYTNSVIYETIKFYNPNIEIDKNKIEFEMVKNKMGFVFQTNLNYFEINKQIPNNVDGKLINPTGLILNILETRGDMYIASTLNAEIATTSLNMTLMKLKFKDIYEKTTKNVDNIYQFNDFIFSDGYAIREAINSGEKTFKQFIDILDKADKFKNWLEKVDDDKSIIKEYHDAVTKETWVDKLPSKAFRWSFFTGAGFALDLALTGGMGTAIGLGLSIGDAFLLDKLIKGWKPNSFIDGDLKKFIK